MLLLCFEENHCWHCLTQNENVAPLDFPRAMSGASSRRLCVVIEDDLSVDWSLPDSIETGTHALSFCAVDQTNGRISEGVLIRIVKP
jgi:hypothetical protein